MKIYEMCPIWVRKKIKYWESSAISLMSDEGIFPKINPKNTLFAQELLSNKTSRGALSIHPWNDTVFIQKPDARNGKHLKSILIEMGFK